ncbi:MAG: hypothetical protein HYV07_16845 [Deltaproteobacteria bacterium]|nr:hypothetical protein [Deltaproteobacteria bacterium]
MHGADVYVGLRPPARAVLSAIEPIELAVATVKSSGEPTPAKVSIRLHRIDHHSAVRGLGTGATELASRPVGVEVRALEVETDESGRASSSLDSPGPGAYELTVSVRDTNGRESSARNRVTVGGEGSIAWPRFDHERIDLVTDKPRYKVGDVAKLVVKTPFEEATALLTIERSGVLLHRLVTIRRDTPIIEVPIEERFAPNVFASIVVLRGRAHGERDAFGFETGAPAFRMGYAQLEVGRESRRLPLSVTLDRTTAAPGEDLTIDVSTTGKKLSPGEVTIAVVDEAVLAMTHFVTPDPLPELLPAKGLGIRTAETRLDLPYSRRERQERIFPSGDGGDGFALSTMPDEVRKLMKSTAYWNPRVALDRNGHARVQFTLPDNLTTYRVMIVGYDLEGRAGSSEAKITIRKPLMAQPVLPRFARPADTFRAEVRVFDGTGVGGIVDGRFELSGLELDKREAGRPDATAKGRGTRLEQRLELPANGSVAFEVPVVVTGRGEARIRFAAALGASKDAVEISLPILQTGAERKLVISRAISRRGEIEVPLPAGRVPGTTHLEVLASSTNLSELKDSVEYLMQYPNGCIEQTTSTAYPLVVLEDLLPDMGVTVNRENLRKFATAGVERILSFQTQSGGLSYWPGGAEPHAFATSFGLTALIEAKKRGYDVPSEKLARMADYLESALARGSVTEQIPHGAIADGDTRALFVMTLGRLGRPQPAWISTLWRERAKLSPFGLGFLAVALEESSGDKSLVPEVLAAIRQASVEKESESYFELARKGGFSFDSPLRTHASSLLAFASTSGGEAGAKLMNGLLKRKTGYGIWGNTQENVFGIMAVAKMATQTPSGAVSPLTIGLDGETVQAAGAEAGSKRTVRYSVGPDRLALPAEARTHRIEIAASDAKPVKVTVRATYEASLDDPKNRAASANGFTLKRTVTTLDGKAVTEDLALGSLVRVALDVTTDAARHYVAISDPLPAGLEALNASLDTTERVTLGEATAEVTAALAKLSFSEVRDARVAFFADDLPAGAYRWVYVARVTTAGRYLRPAARVEEMYQESIAATTEVDFVEVR